ncbi:1406_t:CDS:2 [Entrophospora sp. SA101]|nr:1406_t:CDS:2 [Entrophospora sp. SA101]
MSKQQQKQKSLQAITANNKRDNQREKLKDNWEVSTAVTTFDEMKLKPEVLNGIRELNIAKPTPLQQRGITALLTRKDCVIQVPRCEERALTYLTAILEQIEPEEKICQAVVIIHLKDLCYVIQDFLSILGKELQLSCFTCVGGFPLRKDIERLMNSPQIIIATPGRLIDLISQRRIDFSGVKTVVVEDSCIMFNSTFRSQTFDIIFRLARRYDTDDRQRVQRVLMTTATTFTLADIKNRILQEPHIVIDDSSHIKDGLRLYYSIVDKEDQKLDALFEFLKMVLVSFNVGNFHDKFNIFALHLSTEQLERHEIIKSFWNKKSTKSSITITLDCFASVLAFYPVKYCIQFDLPFKKENYQDRDTSRRQYRNNPYPRQPYSTHYNNGIGIQRNVNTYQSSSYISGSSGSSTSYHYHQQHSNRFNNNNRETGPPTKVPKNQRSLPSKEIPQPSPKINEEEVQKNAIRYGKFELNIKERLDSFKEKKKDGPIICHREMKEITKGFDIRFDEWSSFVAAAPKIPPRPKEKNPQPNNNRFSPYNKASSSLSQQKQIRFG